MNAIAAGLQFAFEVRARVGEPVDIGMEKLLAGEAVDPGLIYFRTCRTFETAAPQLEWLTRSIFIGAGERYPSEVVVRFWRVE